jgi:hypothetical protein
MTEAESVEELRRKVAELSKYKEENRELRERLDACLTCDGGFAINANDNDITMCRQHFNTPRCPTHTHRGIAGHIRVANGVDGINVPLCDA